MARSSFSRRQLKDASNCLFFVTASLAISTPIFFFFYMSSTSLLLVHPRVTHHFHVNPELKLSTITPPLQTSSILRISIEKQINFSSSTNLPETTKIHDHQQPPLVANISDHNIIGSPQPSKASENHVLGKGAERQLPKVISQVTTGHNNIKNTEVLHDKDLFHQEYKQMNKTLKIFIYPHKKNHPFANVLLPVDYEPSGNYASESYFKKSLFKSHFITKNPSKADLFYLPFSIASLRNDKRIGVGGIQKFIKKYIKEISEKYPYWNRTGGADHFYVACHSVGRTAMEEVIEVRLNSIQVVCSSSYFVPGYVAHKDVSIPQIWPRKGNPPSRDPYKRNTLAFYAGAMNSRDRKYLVQVWENDTDISVHQNRLKTPYSEALLGSKYCLHAKGFEVNTARIGDAIYYGCVPVILADHYDLPFGDILNWESFSVVVSTENIPMLKKILLEEISFEMYLKLQRNVMKVRKYFQWQNVVKDFDVFHMVMYELWIRRSHVRLSLNSLLDFS